MDENPLKRCLKGVIRCEWWISELRRVGSNTTPQKMVYRECVCMGDRRNLFMWTESNTWFRNHKNKKKGTGEEGEGGS